MLRGVLAPMLYASVTLSGMPSDREVMCFARELLLRFFTQASLLRRCRVILTTFEDDRDWKDDSLSITFS